jgi:hypothetical protein
MISPVFYSNMYPDFVNSKEVHTAWTKIPQVRATGQIYVQGLSDSGHHSQTKPNHYCPSLRYPVCVCTWGWAEVDIRDICVSIEKDFVLLMRRFERTNSLPLPHKR